jgi:hypothetical protein
VGTFFLRHEEWGDVNARAAACRRFIIINGVAEGRISKKSCTKFLYGLWLHSLLGVPSSGCLFAGDTMQSAPRGKTTLVEERVRRGA